MLTPSYTLNMLFKIRDALFFLVNNPESSWAPDFRRELENALAKVRQEIDREISYKEDEDRSIKDLHPDREGFKP